MVQPWVGSLMSDLAWLSCVLCGRAGGVLPFRSSLHFAQIADYVPKLGCGEVAWLLSNCVCAAKSSGLHSAARESPLAKELAKSWWW